MVCQTGIDAEMEAFRFGIHCTSAMENARGLVSRANVGSLLMYSSCVHLDPSCLTRAVPGLQARLSSPLWSRRVAPASTPHCRYWASFCARGRPQVLRRSFVSGGEEQERSHSRGASADHSIFPVRGSPRTVSPTLRWGTPTSSTGRPPVQALSSPCPSMPATSESPPSTAWVYYSTLLDPWQTPVWWPSAKDREGVPLSAGLAERLRSILPRRYRGLPPALLRGAEVAQNLLHGAHW